MQRVLENILGQFGITSTEMLREYLDENKMTDGNTELEEDTLLNNAHNIPANEQTDSQKLLENENLPTDDSASGEDSDFEQKKSESNHSK